MENQKIVEMLDTITNYISGKEYQKALRYIESKKTEINKKTNPASEYMDALIKELK